MKFQIALLICTTGVLTASPTYSQRQTLDVEYRGNTIITVLDDLKARTDYQFLYYKEIIPADAIVSISRKGASLEDVLNEVLVRNGLKYMIEGDLIVISRADRNSGQQPSNSPPQRLQARGRVVDHEGNPVAGATVIVRGTTTGTSTDSRGEFTLEVPREEVTLDFSFVGKESREVRFTGQQFITVELAEKPSEMGEVVVTGIFTKARESYTGSVTTIDETELKRSGNRSLLSAIRNIDPSFNIVDNLEYGSDPNRLPDITMRGRTGMDVNVRDIQDESTIQSKANLPLFILDGFEISLQRFMDMDQELVQTITLLKDASATALYGSRGANGIVVITSKRPEPGKLRVSYRGTLSIEAPDFTSYNLMNSREKLEYEKLAGLYNHSYSDFQVELDQFYNERRIDVERGVDNYWLKYPVRTAVGNRHSVRIDGGAENLSYAATLAYNNVAGVMKQSSRDTYSGNIYLSYEWKNLKFMNDLTVAYNKSYNSPYGSFSDYANMSPLYTPYDDNGNVKKMLNDRTIGSSVDPQVVGNPLYDAKLPTRDDGSYTNIQNNFAVEWYIIPELFVRGRFGFTKQDDRSDKYLSREHTSFEDDFYTGDNYKLRGSYNYSTGYHFAYEGDVTLNFNKTLNGVHQLYAGFSFNFADDKDETYSILAQGFSALDKINIGMANAYAVDGKPVTTEQHSRRFGNILNLNYTYDRRYFADISGKLEGSSKFGANDRTAPFYSVGIGWNIHNEKFLAGSNAVNNLRLRASYGTTGSQNFSAYQALTTYRYLSQTYEHWTGAYMLALGNPDLSWQKTRQLNVGLETNLFNNRLRLVADFYNKLTDDLLTDINIPTSGGFGSYKANVGEVRNRGVELNATVNVIRDLEKDIFWSVGASMVHNRNRIMKISNALEFLNESLLGEENSNPSFLYKEGESMNTIYVVRSLGIDPANGREIFLNRYGERTYEWNSKDKVACGVNEPKFLGNVNTMFRWKNLTFNAVFSYRAGGYIYNQTLIDKVENIVRGGNNYNNPWRNVDRRALYERWQKPGDIAYFKNITDMSTTRASSRFVMKENTFRLNTLNLTYEFDTEWSKRNLGMQYFSVGVYSEDVFTISTIKQERGTSYPFSRKYSVSVTARF